MPHRPQQLLETASRTPDDRTGSDGGGEALWGVGGPGSVTGGGIRVEGQADGAKDGEDGIRRGDVGGGAGEGERVGPGRVELASEGEELAEIDVGGREGSA